MTDDNLPKKYQKFNEKKWYKLLNYDKKWHLELLKQSKPSDLKLLPYSVILLDQLNWEIRDQYWELLENYMEERIGLSELWEQFRERYQSIEKVADLLKSKLRSLHLNQQVIKILKPYPLWITLLGLWMK